MRISEALKDLDRVAIDTSLLIYYLEDHETYADKAEAVFRYILMHSPSIFTSVITVTETLTKPKKQGDVDLEQKYLRMFDSYQITLIRIGRTIAERAASLRSSYNTANVKWLNLSPIRRRGLKPPSNALQNPLKWVAWFKSREKRVPLVDFSFPQPGTLVLGGG